VDPIITTPLDSTDKMLHDMEVTLMESGRVKPGESIVFVAGQPVGLRGSTNMLKLHRVTGLSA
jgi:pyruvate kinase